MISNDLKIAGVVLLPQVKKDSLASASTMNVMVLFKVSKPENLAKVMLCMETAEGKADIGIFTAEVVSEGGKLFLKSNNLNRPLGRVDASIMINIPKDRFFNSIVLMYAVDKNGKMSNIFKHNISGPAK